jgi:hypothetical protein
MKEVKEYPKYFAMKGDCGFRIILLYDRGGLTANVPSREANILCQNL